MPFFSETGAEVSAEVSTDVPGGDERNFSDSTLEAYHLTYEEELLQFFQWTESGKDEVAHLAVKASLEKSRFRSVIWQILLGILPHQSYLWVQKLRHLRSAYRSKKDRILINPRLSSEGDNPLSQDSSSAWYQYFCDKELRATIRKDVVRTSPEDKFFNSASIQSTMVNILFLYAREHDEICYRQGMHEVLAPLLLVLHADQQSLLLAQKVASVQGLILEVLDHTYLEEDAYWLLEGIMKHLACTYTIPDVTPSSRTTLPFTGELPYQTPKSAELESEVCSRMRRIRDEILDVWDPELRQHLIDMDIPLYFGIRWLRVMFGQEFVKRNLLILWDAILGANSDFGLVDYIVVAMLMVIRSRLLEEDFTGCLDLLVHYPAGNQVHSILRLALHMLKPKEFHRPDDIFATAKPAVGAGQSTISRRIRQLVSRSRKADLTVSPTKVFSSRTPSKRFRGNRPVRADSSYFQSYSRPPQQESSQEATELLTALQSKVFLTSLRLATYQVTLEKHLRTPGAPISVVKAVEGLKEIADMLAELGPPQIEVETAVEATQSPNVSAPSSPDPLLASEDPNPASPSPTTSNKPQTPSPAATGRPGRKVDVDLMPWKTPRENQETLNTGSNFVVSNPLRNMYGTSDYEPDRETKVYRNFQHVLGEGRIFARIKQ